MRMKGSLIWSAISRPRAVAAGQEELQDQRLDQALRQAGGCKRFRLDGQEGVGDGRRPAARRRCRAAGRRRRAADLRRSSVLIRWITASTACFRAAALASGSAAATVDHASGLPAGYRNRPRKASDFRWHTDGLPFGGDERQGSSESTLALAACHASPPSGQRPKVCRETGPVVGRLPRVDLRAGSFGRTRCAIASRDGKLVMRLCRPVTLAVLTLACSATREGTLGSAIATSLRSDYNRMVSAEDEPCRRSRASRTKVRIGAVTYLNAWPLIVLPGRSWPREAEIVIDLPSRLADGLAAGQLDVASCPRSSISATRAARSSPTPASPATGRCGASSSTAACRWSGSRSLALDEGSRTSAALVRILARASDSAWRPTLQPLPIGAAAGGCAGRRRDAHRRPGHAAARTASSRSSGTWARSGRAGRGCRSCLPCGWPGRASTGRRLAEALAAARDEGLTPAGGDRPAGGPGGRHPGGRVPGVPARSPGVPPRAAAAAGAGVVFRLGRGTSSGLARRERRSACLRSCGDLLRIIRSK